MLTIHLCIDADQFYEKRFLPEDWCLLWGNASKLITGLDCLNIPTIYVAYDGAKDADKSRGQVFDTYANLKRLLPEDNVLRFALPLADHNFVAIKTNISAFSNKALVQFIRLGKFKHIILSGIYEAQTWKSSDACVTETARDFAEESYRVSIAAEATNCCETIRALNKNTGAFELPPLAIQ